MGISNFLYHISKGVVFGSFFYGAGHLFGEKCKDNQLLSKMPYPNTPAPKADFPFGPRASYETPLWRTMESGYSVGGVAAMLTLGKRSVFLPVFGALTALNFCYDNKCAVKFKELEDIKAQAQVKLK